MRGQKGKFFRRQKFAFLLKEHTKNQKMSGGGNWFEKSNFSGKIRLLVSLN
jgi:hypothetical protein